MWETRMLPIGTNTFRIYIDRRDDEAIRGRIAGGGTSTVVEFSSISRMILLLDSMLDRQDYSLHPSPPDTAGDPDYELEILFRQNSSWQGRLKLLKEGKEATFRSVLELIFLLETI